MRTSIVITRNLSRKTWYRLILIYFFLLAWQQYKSAGKQAGAAVNGGTETGSGLSEYIMLISLENRSWISEWQFKQWQGKNILRSEGPGLWAVSVLLHLCLRMLMVGLGIYWAGGLTSWYPPEFLRVTNMGRRSWITMEQADHNDLLPACTEGRPQRKKKRDLIVGVLIFSPSAHKRTFMVALINTFFIIIINDLIAVIGQKDHLMNTHHRLTLFVSHTCVRASTIWPQRRLPDKPHGRMWVAAKCAASR